MAGGVLNMAGGVLGSHAVQTNLNCQWCRDKSETRISMATWFLFFTPELWLLHYNFNLLSGSNSDFVYHWVFHCSSQPNSDTSWNNSSLSPPQTLLLGSEMFPIWSHSHEALAIFPHSISTLNHSDFPWCYWLAFATRDFWEDSSSSSPHGISKGELRR